MFKLRWLLMLGAIAMVLLVIRPIERPGRALMISVVFFGLATIAFGLTQSFWVAVVACFAVVGVLLIGIGGFAKGGEFNRKNANKLMRLRLILQFVAVLLILLFVWVSRQGG